VSKRSPEKSDPAGRKHPLRLLVDGSATEERVFVSDAPGAVAGCRDLDVVFVDSGVAVESLRGPGAVLEARAHHAAARAELSGTALRLSPGDPAIPTVFH
jgi:nicotinate phosphoribosyltransferase